MRYPITAIETIASESAASERASTNRVDILRHGRHKSATAAPSKRPLDRVNVLRYKKLVRVSLSSTKRSAVVAMIAPLHAMSSTPEIFGRIHFAPNTRVNNSGQMRYHCSSTASDHKWRNTGSELAAKYGVSTAKICHQFEKYPSEGNMSRRKSGAESVA